MRLSRERHGSPRPVRPAASTASASKPGMTSRGVPVTTAARHDGEAANVGERQAREPRMATGVDTKALGRRSGRRPDGFVRQHHALWLARRARGRDDERVAFLHAQPVWEGVLLAVRTDDPGGAQRFEHRPAGDGGEARVQRCRGVSGVPDRPEGVDKPHATREIKCDELGHRPVA